MNTLLGICAGGGPRLFCQNCKGKQGFLLEGAGIGNLSLWNNYILEEIFDQRSPKKNKALASHIRPGTIKAGTLEPDKIAKTLGEQSGREWEEN